LDWPTRVRTLDVNIGREILDETAILSRTLSGAGSMQCQTAGPGQSSASWAVELIDRLRIWPPRCCLRTPERVSGPRSTVHCSAEARASSLVGTESRHQAGRQPNQPLAFNWIQALDL
jgi:hypothetical protein